MTTSTTENEPRLWQQICCAVDLSEASHVVLRQAIALARWSGAELVLFHVVVPPTPITFDVLSLAMAGQRQRELPGDVLSRLCAGAELELDRPVRSCIVRG